MTTQTPLDDLAGLVIANTPLERGGRPKISLALVVLVVKAIVLAFQCLMIMDEKAERRVRKPGLLTRWRLRRVVKRVLAEQGSVDSLDGLMDGLLAAGASASLEILRGVVRQVAAEESTRPTNPRESDVLDPPTAVRSFLRRLRITP